MWNEVGEAIIKDVQEKAPKFGNSLGYGAFFELWFDMLKKFVIKKK